MQSDSRPDQSVDVIVIGAGASGLTAARDLKRNGLKVALLEARERFGGRLMSHEMDNGVTVDLGGQWVAPTQHRVLELVRETGAQIFQTFDKGHSLYHFDGVSTQYSGVFPEFLNEEEAQEIADAFAELDRIGSTIPLDAPWNAPDAAALDAITYDAWVRSRTRSENARYVLLSISQGVLSSEACDLSLLHTAFYFAAAGGVQELTGTSGGGQDSRFEAGFQTLFTHIAEELSEAISYNSPVERIEYGGDGVIVQTNGRRIAAKRVIIAMSPTIASRIRFSPPLPGLRDQLAQRMPMGTAIKILVTFERPFWRDTGLNGFSISDYPMALTYDNSPPDGSSGMLLGFIEGEPGRIWGEKTSAERESAVIKWLANIFGPEAEQYTQYIDKYWVDEEFSRGCYAGIMGPGVWTSFGRALRAPIGPIHWAGTETATYWMGYVEGAMQAGERAAQEVADAIKAATL